MSEPMSVEIRPTMDGKTIPEILASRRQAPWWEPLPLSSAPSPATPVTDANNAVVVAALRRSQFYVIVGGAA